MNITDLNSEGLKHDFKVIIPYSNFENRFNERLVQQGQKAKIPGFRPGKAPLPILAQRYGDSIKPEAFQRTLQEGVQYLLTEKKLKPALQPKVDVQDFVDGKDIEITVSVEVLPEIKPVDLKKLSFEHFITAVPQDKLEQAYHNLAQRQKVPGEPQDKAAENGDVAVIDFKGKLEDGSAIEGGSGNNTYLELGSGSFIPGFEEQLVGAKAGASVTVKVSFPTDYHESKLAGKKAVFDVRVNEVRPVSTPELNDEFASKLGFKDLAALQVFIKEQLEGEGKRLSLLIAKRQILDYFAENVKFNVPQGLVDLEFDSIWKQYQNELQKTDNKGQSASEADNAEEERARQQYKDIAERRVRLGLLLADIGRQYEVQVTQKELESAMMQTARSYPGQERQVFDYFRNNSAALASLRAPIFEDKVIELILDKAKLSEKKLSFEELEAKVRELTEGDEELNAGTHDHGDEHHVHGPHCNHD